MSASPPTHMQGLWLEDQVLALRQDLRVPEPAAGEALVKLRLAGICATDLEMTRGYYPFRGIPGHEFVGEVVEAPGESGWVGQRVVGEINLACGTCAPCRLGNRTHCETRRTLGIHDYPGVFAEYLVLPLAVLHRVSPSLPDEMAVFTEPLAAALEIQEQVHIRPGDRVLLVGAGRLGQLIAQTLALGAHDLQVVVRHAHQGALLRERGVETLSEAQVESGKWDVVVDATGAAGGFALARRAVRPRGVMVLKSTFAGEAPVDLSSLVVDEITLVGSRCGPFPPALRLLAEGKVEPRPLIAARYALAQGLGAFEHAARPGALKVLLDPMMRP